MTAPAQLPPEHIQLDGLQFRIGRCWPAGRDPGAGLALEASTPAGPDVRGGRWRAGRLELYPVGSDPKLESLPGHASSGTVVSHRPRKRAVVRVASGGAGDRFVKVVRPGRAEAILAGISRAGAFEAAFRTPQVLGSSSDSVSFGALAGSSLHDVARFAPGQWAAAWRSVGEALVHSHDATAAPPDDDTPRHGIAEEIGVLQDWAGRTGAWMRDPEGLSKLVALATGRLAALEEAWAPSHRDLHDKQLLWSDGTAPGLLDVDTACLAHPALDLGNLRAHALWRRVQGLWAEQHARQVTEVVDAAADELGVAPGAVAAFEWGSLVRIRCVYAVRPGYAEVAEQLQRDLPGLLPPR